MRKQRSVRPAAVDAFAARIQGEFPKLNVLINNAGLAKPQNLTSDHLDVSVCSNIHSLPA